MNYFRISIYLTFKNFIRSFLNLKVSENKIEKLITKNSKKKNFIVTSQLRVGFLILLKYLKKQYPKKNHIIFQPFNLPEMINVAKNSGFKTEFTELNVATGNPNLEKIKNKINSRTIGIVITNIFNSPETLINLRKLCNKRKIFLIEDNAIYFDNFFYKKKKKYFSGSFGDYSLYSFNIMKNISAFFGGGVATDDNYFKNYALKEIKKYGAFNKLILFKQIIIFLFLKLISYKIIHKIYIQFLKISHTRKFFLILKVVYPSLKFKKINFPSFYFTKISSLAKASAYLQLMNLNQRQKNHHIRKIKNIYYYKLFKKLKIKNVKLFEIKDFNFQNFIDFPILVKNKEKLNNYLLSKGIETKYIYYQDCAKIFAKKQSNSVSKNSKFFCDKIIGLPTHSKITRNYMDHIGKTIKNFYDR